MTQTENKDQNLIHITVSSQNFEDIVFKIKPTTKFDKIIEKYCERFSIKSKETVVFLFDGEKIKKDSTPAEINLEEGDVIEAIQEQVGGNLC